MPIDPPSATANLRFDSLSNGIVIHPNPNNGFFNLRFEEPATSCQEVRILSADNQILFAKKLKGDDKLIEMDMTSLPQDFYYGKFYFKEGIVTKRIWIQ